MARLMALLSLTFLFIGCDDIQDLFPDMAVADASADMAMPDMAIPDGAMPDMAMPDGAIPDATLDMGPDAAPNYLGYEGADNACYMIELERGTAIRLRAGFLNRLDTLFTNAIAGDRISTAWFEGAAVPSYTISPVVDQGRFFQICFDEPVLADHACHMVSFLKNWITDQDQDGLLNGEEDTNFNQVFDPADLSDFSVDDTDGAGELDGSEVLNGRDPKVGADDVAGAAIDPVPNTLNIGRALPVRSLYLRTSPTANMRSWHLDAIGLAVNDVNEPPIQPIPPVEFDHAALVLIDSGIEADIALGLGVDIQPVTDLELIPNGVLHGHGTAMAILMRQVSPATRMHSLRILGDDGLGSIADLARSIEWVANHTFCGNGDPIIVECTASDETCNAQDDDCDGLIDEAVENCAPPVCCVMAGEYFRTPEVCGGGAVPAADPTLCNTTCCEAGGTSITTRGTCLDAMGGQATPPNPVVVNLSVGWPEELSQTRTLEGADNCSVQEDPGGEAIRTQLQRLAAQDDRGEKISVFAAAGNRPGRPIINQNLYPSLMARAPNTPETPSCDAALAEPIGQRWFFPARWSRQLSCNPGLTPTYLVTGVGAVNDALEPTVQSIRDAEGPIVAPGQHVYVDHPSADVEPNTAICGDDPLPDLDNHFRAPHVLTGTSVASALTSAAAIEAQIRHAEQGGEPFDRHSLTRLIYNTGCSVGRDADFENVPVHVLSASRLLRAVSDPQCAMWLEQCQANTNNDRQTACAEPANLNCLQDPDVACHLPTRPDRSQYTPDVICQEIDAGEDQQYLDADSECPQGEPCAHEYAIDRYSSGRLGGQPGLIGCPDCGLFGSTLYLELSIDTAFTSTYTILGAYTSYGISNQLTYYGLPQLSANPGATIKITNMPNISAANCPKQASLHLVIKKISSGYVFTDTSPLSITCIP